MELIRQQIKSLDYFIHLCLLNERNCMTLIAKRDELEETLGAMRTAYAALENTTTTL